MLHPGIVSSTQLDLALLRFLAVSLTSLCPSLAWLNLEAAVGEFQSLLEAQLDLRTEAANLLRFRENFSQADSSVLFPRPVLRLCGRSVLVEEWVEGDSVQQYLAISDRGGNNSLIALHNDIHPTRGRVLSKRFLGAIRCAIRCVL